jgi:RNA polymerase sigma-70 factor (ECF subfamily)
VTVSLKIHVECLPEGMWADEKRSFAFEEMYRRCYPQLVDVCRRNLAGRGDPESIAQEAFVRAWTSLDRFSGARPFWPWLATIAKRLCIDHRRRLERESGNLHVAAALNERATASPDEVVESNEECASVVLALNSLKPAEQRVITLRDLNGWSYDEIARFEGVTVESIRGSLKRARASLRRSYARVAVGASALVSWRPMRPLRQRVRAAAWRPRTTGLLCSSDAVAGLVVSVLAAAFATTEPPSIRYRTTSPASSPPTSVGARAASVAAFEPVPVRAAPLEEDRVVVELVPLAAPRGGEEGGGIPPEATVLHDITPSPSFASDRALFGVGTVATGCSILPCTALFRSDDGGGRWTQLPARGFTGGSLLLPPSFPADPRIFVAGPTGLQVSLDGGSSFELVAPIVGEAAFSPRFATGDKRIVIGQAPLWEYLDDAGLTRPSATVVPSTSSASVPLFSARFPENRLMFLGSTVVGPTGRQQSTVFRCVDSLCEGRAPLGDTLGLPSLAESPGSDGSVVAWVGDQLFVSDDEGRTFVRRALPIPGAVRAVQFDSDGRLFVGIRGHAGRQSRGGLVLSVDQGRTWQVLGAGSALEGGVEALAAPTARQIVVALAGTAGGGILCSVDAGVSWARRCAA